MASGTCTFRGYMANCQCFSHHYGPSAYARNCNFAAGKRRAGTNPIATIVVATNAAHVVIESIDQTFVIKFKIADSGSEIFREWNRNIPSHGVRLSDGFGSDVIE